MVLEGSDFDEITEVNTILNYKSNVQYLRVLKYLLGFEVARTQDGILLWQIKYAIDLIQDAGLIGGKSLSTPMQLHLQLHKSYGHPLFEPTTYRRLIGILLYLTHFIPKIAYKLSKLNHFLDVPLMSI